METHTSETLVHGHQGRCKTDSPLPKIIQTNTGRGEIVEFPDSARDTR